MPRFCSRGSAHAVGRRHPDLYLLVQTIVNETRVRLRARGVFRRLRRRVGAKGEWTWQNIWWKRVTRPKGPRVSPARAALGGTGRRAAAAKAVEGLGGKVESFYYAFGDVDAYVIFDVPDNVSAAALSLAVGQSGGINTKTVVLITPEEMDQAGKKAVDFRPPGR